ncbi:MAG: PhzF family phenazine biosynthesis protein [Saprospiraceae bacterium]|nr:PhzF family phenazine biosynthesis protein [Saprospiraceae bacterium]
MDLSLYQVDAFTDQLFAGNPAAVCLLEEWLPAEQMLQIAQENNLAETAFCLIQGDVFSIKWFTPEIEMDLCGHATLATAHVLFQYYYPKRDRLSFESNSGELIVKRQADWYQLDFPSRDPQPASLPAIISQGIGATPKEVLKARDYVLVYDSQEEIEAIQPNIALLNTINIDPGGIVVTAPGHTVDFVSRFFTPQASIFEDPVTGSAHCSLIPFWSKRLKKDQLTAEQLSSRKGVLRVEDRGERVLIGGQAITYMQATIKI